MIDPVEYTPARAALDMPRIAVDANKYSRGTVAVIGGSEEYPGAPVLASLAAARVGAGYVRLVTPGAAARVARTHLLSIPVSAASDECARELSRAAADFCVKTCAKSKVLVVGPGMGRGEGSRSFIQQLSMHVSRGSLQPLGIVFDADALNLIAEHPDYLEGFARTPVILTPHEGEAARLLGRKVDDRTVDAHLLAERLGATVVLKGPHTLVVDADGYATVDTQAGPELAKAGTGDVLAGMIGGLLAQELEAPLAASLAVCLHALSARYAASTLSAHAVMPEDIIGSIGFAISAFGE